MQLNLFVEKTQATIPAVSLRKPINLSTVLHQHSADIDTALQGIFRTAQEETRLQQARRIMGNAVGDLSDEELEVCLTEFQHLLDQWLDEFERAAFDNQTLRQVLGQG